MNLLTLQYYDTTINVPLNQKAKVVSAHSPPQFSNQRWYVISKIEKID